MKIGDLGLQKEKTEHGNEGGKKGKRQNEFLISHLIFEAKS